MLGPGERGTSCLTSNREGAIPAADAEGDTVYKAVLNHEEQYTIWPAGRELPIGWPKAGKDRIAEV